MSVDPSPQLATLPEERRPLASTFSIDSRALAIVRIFLATLILAQSLFLEWSRPREASGLGEFFTQYGDIIVIPFAVMMLLGWRTRYAVVLCWLGYTLRVRAGLLEADVAVSIGDVILSMALFWSMFLPMGRHLSLDRGEPLAPVRFLSVASGALLMQVFVIYFSSGLLKSLDEWVFQATAMETILSHPNYETTLGVALLDFPVLLALLSVATVLLEVVGAILVILPGKTLALRRLIVVPMFIALHIGIALFMGLGIFPYVLVAAWLVFLPPSFWDRVWRGGTTQMETVELLTDRSVWRNLAAGIALVVVAVSNVITWIYFPEVEGAARSFQTLAAYLVLYQQWAMFSVPSSLP
jgi:hypothetical protein